MKSPFEYVDCILNKKKVPDDEDYKNYNPFIVNRALSYHLDCVPYVNEMNLYPSVDKDMQFHYYLNSIRSMKRKFQPWQKSETDLKIESVKKYFGYSNEKAKDALRILTDEQVAEIIRRTTKGGVTK